MLTAIFLFVLFCYIVKALSKFFLSVTDEGELFGWWSKHVIEPLALKSHKSLFHDILYRASGGCAKCNVMWFALILYPVYAILAHQAGVAISEDIYTVAGLWLLSPILTYDLYTIS